MNVEEFGAGKSIPVPVKDVDKAIPALWRKLAEAAKAAGGKKAITRACMWNLVIRTPGGAHYEQAKKLIDAISVYLPARVIVLDADKTAPAGPIQAWVEANFHSGGGGAQQIGSEELTFKATGDAVPDLASLVRAHLLGDLPVASMWLGAAPGGDGLDDEMLSAARRVIIGADGAEDILRAVHSVLDGGKLPRNADVTSLSWLRSSHWRQMVAGLFDPPTDPADAYKISDVRVVASTNQASTALLFVGWLAARLGWTNGRATEKGGRTFAFDGPAGAVKANVDVGGTSDDVFTRVEVQAPAGRSSITRAGNAVVLETPGTSARKMPRHIPGDAELWLAALSARGRDPVFLEALRCVTPLVR